MRAAASTAREPMQVTVETSAVERVRAGTLVVGAFADGTLPVSSRRIDLRSKGRLSAVMRLGDLGEAAGSTLLLHDLPGVEVQRVVLVSLGRRADFGDSAFRDALNGVARMLAAGAAHDAAVALADVELRGRSLAWRLQHAARAARRRRL